VRLAEKATPTHTIPGWPFCASRHRLFAADFGHKANDLALWQQARRILERGRPDVRRARRGGFGGPDFSVWNLAQFPALAGDGVAAFGARPAFGEPPLLAQFIRDLSAATKALDDPVLRMTTR